MTNHPNTALQEIIAVAQRNLAMHGRKDTSCLTLATHSKVALEQILDLCKGGLDKYLEYKEQKPEKIFAGNSPETDLKQ
jgi:hypothetical protein